MFQRERNLILSFMFCIIHCTCLSMHIYVGKVRHPVYHNNTQCNHLLIQKSIIILFPLSIYLNHVEIFYLYFHSLLLFTHNNIWRNIKLKWCRVIILENNTQIIKRPVSICYRKWTCLFKIYLLSDKTFFKERKGCIQNIVQSRYLDWIK